MRGAWGKKCLESMGGRRIIDRVESMDGLKAGREIGKWINGIVAVANVSTLSSEGISY
jgi:exocyst complex protein 7